LWFTKFYSGYFRVLGFPLPILIPATTPYLAIVWVCGLGVPYPMNGMEEKKRSKELEKSEKERG
jgi:hypothetical protein